MPDHLSVSNLSFGDVPCGSCISKLQATKYYSSSVYDVCYGALICPHPFHGLTPTVHQAILEGVKDQVPLVYASLFDNCEL